MRFDRSDGSKYTALICFDEITSLFTHSRRDGYNRSIVWFRYKAFWKMKLVALLIIQLMCMICSARFGRKFIVAPLFGRWTHENNRFENYYRIWNLSFCLWPRLHTTSVSFTPFSSGGNILEIWRGVKLNKNNILRTMGSIVMIIIILLGKLNNFHQNIKNASRWTY